MICRHPNSGQKLDVAGVNEITVLIDRSETLLTEVAINTWQPGRDGPPHQHERKEQNFLVLSGQGEVIIGGEKFPAAPGSFFYVPAATVHQTITRGREPLRYFLFNAFLDADKEGHASFADHIDKVKHIRRLQADTQRADMAVTDPFAAPVARRRGRCVTLAAAPWRAMLLSRVDTECCEAFAYSMKATESLALPFDLSKEQTLFVFSGSGMVRVGPDEIPVVEGHTVYVPPGAAVASSAGKAGLRLVSFGTVLKR